MLTKACKMNISYIEMKIISNTKRKTCICDQFLRLNFSRLKQVACDKLTANDKGYYMKEKINKYSSSFAYIIYILSHVTKMQLFWSQFMTNDVLPRVLIFNYLNYLNYYFEII